MENRLNLDALKKELSSKNGSSASAFSPPAGAGGAAATVQIVQKASPQIGGLKLVSLDGPQVEVKKSSGIKLVSLDAGKQQPASSDSAASSAGENESSVPSAADTSSRPAVLEASDDAILQEVSPVFKNLTKDTHENWQMLKQRYEKYKRAKQQKMLVYGAGGLVAALALVSLISPLLSPNDAGHISVTSTTNVNDNINDQHGSAALTVQGEQLLLALSENFSVSDNLRARVQEELPGQDGVTLLQAVRWALEAAELPYLYATDSEAPEDTYLVKVARAAGIAQEYSDMEQALTPVELEQLIAFLKTKKGNSPDGLATGSGTVLPSDAINILPDGMEPPVMESH